MVPPIVYPAVKNKSMMPARKGKKITAGYYHHNLLTITFKYNNFLYGDANKINSFTLFIDFFFVCNNRTSIKVLSIYTDKI